MSSDEDMVILRTDDEYAPGWMSSDEDMVTSDTTKTTTSGHIYQVNSSSNILIYYFINRDKDTTPTFVICRIKKDLYKPRVKMRRKPILRGRHFVNACVHTPTWEVAQYTYVLLVFCHLMHAIVRGGQSGVVLPLPCMHVQAWRISISCCLDRLDGHQIIDQSVQAPDASGRPSPTHGTHERAPAEGHAPQGLSSAAQAYHRRLRTREPRRGAPSK